MIVVVLLSGLVVIAIWGMAIWAGTEPDEEEDTL